MALHNPAQVDSLIRSQGIGDAYRLAILANRDGIDAKIP